MKKRFTFLIAAIAAILMMAQPMKVVGQTRTDAYVLDFTTANSSHSGYGDTWTYNNATSGAAQNWSMSKGQNNNGQWEYVKFGGKGGSTTSATTSITSYTQSTFAINSDVDLITVNINGIDGNYTFTSMKLQVSSSSSFNGSLVDEITVNSISNSTVEFEPSEDDYWESGSYYKILITGTAKGKNNVGIKITTIVFQEYESGGSTPTAVAPEFNPTGGAVKVGSTVTMSTTTDGGVIHYTTNGNAPDANSATYTEPVQVNADMTIKAITIADGYNNSSVTTGTYKIVQHAGTEADPYTIADARIAIDAANGQTLNNKYITGIVSQVDSYNNNYNSITYWISDDGTTTNQFEVCGGLSFVNGTAFSSINDIQVDDVVVVKGNIKYYSNSSVYEFEQNNNLVSLKYGAPTFYPVAGAVGSGTELTITDNHPNSTIYYTTDGYAPTTSSTPYNPSSKPTITTATTFKAIAVKITNDGDDNYIQSDVADASYTILVPVETPSITLPGGTYTYAQSTTITCDLEGAKIYYTTNGNDPTTSSTEYTDAISINETMTIKAIAAKSGMANSAVAEASYTISIPAINASDVNIAYNETSGTITSTITNAVEGGALTAAITSGNAGTWLSLGTMNGTNVPLNCSVNEGNEDRTATVTLTYTYSGNHTVTKDVTVTQAKYVKDYAELPFSFDGGRGDIATTTGLTQDGLDSDYGSSPKLKFNSAGDCVILKINETPGKLTFDIKGNSLSGTYKFSVLQSADGTAYTTLEEYTSISSSTASKTLTPTSTTRYIKWVYTTKDNGNVALGNINLKAPEPTITVSPESVGVLASGVIDATLSLTYERLEISEAEDFAILFCDENGDELTPAPDWITAEVIDGTSDDYVVSYTVEENDDEERTAYFKVFALGNEDYVYSNLVTVTQAAYVAPENKYIRFSGELVEGDYLIVYNGGAMNNTVTSDRLQYEEVTAINNVIATDDNTIIWHIAKSGNYWTIKNKNDNKYAASNGKNKAQMLDAGTADEALWTITGTTTYDFENKARAAGSDSGNKWLRRNGNYGFACYAETTGGALSLYIKNCVLPVTNDELTEIAEIPEGNITVYDDLTIPSGGNIVLTVSGTLEVVGTLTNTDASHLVIEDGGQLITSSANVKATVKKETYAATAKDAKTNYYWYAISSAVANPNISSATNLITETVAPYHYDLYRYNEAATTTNAQGQILYWENYRASHADFTTLEKGRGYLYRNASNLSITMTGEINVADFKYSVTNSGGPLAGFNLIGNPYSHDIYKGLGTAIPNGDEGFLRTGFYYMDPTTGKWTTGTDNSTAIKPNEGILVQTDANGNITMTNTNASSSAKANNDNIMFKVANSQYSDETYAWFDKGRGLNKISHRNAEVPMIYINQDGEDYAIATMSDDTKMFSLNFKAMTMGKYTLSYKTKGEFNYLHVIDRLTGEDVDMLLEGEYSFVASPSDSDARFIVKLAYLPDYSDGEGDIFAYQNGSDIFVSGEGELQIFDVMGRFVMSERINGVKTISADELSKGVYVLRLVGNGMKTQKIVVK